MCVCVCANECACKYNSVPFRTKKKTRTLVSNNSFLLFFLSLSLSYYNFINNIQTNIKQRRHHYHLSCVYLLNRLLLALCIHFFFPLLSLSLSLKLLLLLFHALNVTWSYVTLFISFYGISLRFMFFCLPLPLK